ncbi:MAG: prolyl oligopeptidase family serine peptidase [Acidobacteriota bacterium]
MSKKWNIVFVVLITSLLVLSGTNGQTLKPLPSEQTWITGGAYRLKTSVFRSEQISIEPVLIVVLHGDAPFNKPDYHNSFAAKVAATNQDVVAVGLLRPGYTDPQGNTSDGDRGLTNGDNWNSKNTEAIAKAIGELERRYHSRKVVVAGHSGGAAITANILGRYPELIDAALLVSCPCDVEKWRQSMFQLTNQPVFQGKIDTLSPIEQIKGISDQVNIIMMVGSQDKVTPPSLSESYQAMVEKLGKKIRLVRLEGKEHEIFLDPAVFAEFVTLLK